MGYDPENQIEYLWRGGKSQLRNPGRADRRYPLTWALIILLYPLV